jgi:hypothetical protein
MFLDLAYLVRQWLRQLGFSRARTLGAFLVPNLGEAHTAGSARREKSQALANTMASLIELNHFSCCGDYNAQLDPARPPVRDAGPPFDHCWLVSFAQGGKANEMRDAIGQLSDLLFCQLTGVLPLPTSDGVSTESNTPPSTRGQPWLPCSFGLYRWTGPHHRLIAEANRYLCGRLVESWQQPGPEAQTVVADTELEKWVQEHIGPVRLLALLEDACTDHFGQPFEQLVAERLKTSLIYERSCQQLNVKTLISSVNQLRDIVTSPADRAPAPERQALVGVLATAAEKLVPDCKHQLQLLVGSLMDRPGVGLAGTEPALTWLDQAVRDTRSLYETMAADLSTSVQDNYLHADRFLSEIVRKSSRESLSPLASTDHLHVLHDSFTGHYRLLALRQLSGLYGLLQEHLSSLRQALGSCAAAMKELLVLLRPAVAPAQTKDLLPSQQACAAEGAREFFRSLSPDDLKLWENEAKEIVVEKFGSIFAFCMQTSWSGRFVFLARALERRARGYVQSRVIRTHVVGALLRRNRAERLTRALRRAYDVAIPSLTAKPPARQTVLLAVPGGAGHEEFLDLARTALPAVDSTRVCPQDDIVLYRECLGQSLSDLMSEAAWKAYRDAIRSGQLSPHSRQDIAPWLTRVESE